LSFSAHSPAPADALVSPTALALGIIALTTLVRIWFVGAGQLDLVQDEAQYWDWSRRLQLSYYSKGPLIAYLIAFWTRVFGDTALGVRAGALLNGALFQLVLYGGLAWLCKRPRAGLWALLVVNGAPLFLAGAALMTTDSPLLVCWTGFLFCLYALARAPERIGPYVLLALCLAVGTLAKYMMLVGLPIAGLYCLALRRRGLLPEGLAGRLTLACLAGALVGLAPILAWNMGNGFVGFKHVSALAAVGSGKPAPLVRFDRFPDFLGSQIGLLTPWLLLFMLVEGWGAWRSWRTWSADAKTGQDIDDARLRWLLAAGFWPLLLFFVLWSFHAKIYPNWPAAAYVAGACLAALWLERAQASGRRMWPWPALAALCFVLLHAQNWIPLPAAYNPTLRLKGWTDLGGRLERIQESASDPRRVFYFSDTYDITAALAFYAPGQPRTFCAYFDRRLSQYDLWPGPQDRQGWDAIYVEKDCGGRLPQQLSEMFEAVNPQCVRTEHRGAPARKFTVAFCRNFKGRWPQALGTSF
jgi:4-amino-4-deoxy-L-arabinose transferase-like glycosyltransferase